MNGINVPSQQLKTIANLGYQQQQPHQQAGNPFVYFSPNTQGKCGRPVYIDARLLPLFLSLVDVDSYKGLRLITGIEQLRSVGGGIGSYQSTVRAARHMSRVGDVSVYYYIEQQKHEEGGRILPSGVFITDLRINKVDAGDRPNIYLIQGKNYEATNQLFFSREISNAALVTDQSIDDGAATALRYAPQDGWGKTLGTEMLFIPNKLSDAQGHWLTPALKSTNSTRIAKQVSAVLSQTQKSRAQDNKDSALPIQVIGDASKVLQAAVAQYTGHLDKLDFEFIEPTAKMDTLLTSLKGKNAKISKPIKASSKESLIALSQVRQRLLQLLEKSPTQDLKKLANTTSQIAGALNAARPQTSGNFLNAARQANRLGRWDK